MTVTSGRGAGRPRCSQTTRGGTRCGHLATVWIPDRPNVSRPVCDQHARTSDAEGLIPIAAYQKCQHLIDQPAPSKRWLGDTRRCLREATRLVTYESGPTTVVALMCAQHAGMAALRRP